MVGLLACRARAGVAAGGQCAGRVAPNLRVIAGRCRPWHGDGDGERRHMTPIDQPTDLKRYYQKRSVVSEYMERRTAQPLNGLLHRRQVASPKQALVARRLRAVLEIACGPGRLT